MYHMKMTRRLMWLLALALGGLQALATRNCMNPDGVSYLDLGDSVANGRLPDLVNAYWSPLYPFLLGCFNAVLNPGPGRECAVAHGVNFLLYAVSLSAFDFLVRELAAERDSPMRSGGIQVLAYCAFIWFGLKWIGVEYLTPDQGVAAVVYLAAGLVTRLRRKPEAVGSYLLLGAVLGAGYLVKAVLFPLSLVILLAAGAGIRRSAASATGLAAAVFVFLAIAAPWMAALSSSKGRFTFSDAGPLSYAWCVNGYRIYAHWRGEEKGSGTPAHPTRMLASSPPVYEFSGPVRGTYPPWYDPSYWNEGTTPHASPVLVLKRLLLNPGEYLRAFGVKETLPVLACLLVMAGCLGKYSPGRAAGHWPIMAPAIAAIVMYKLIIIAPRYLGPFTAILWLSAFTGLPPLRPVLARRRTGRESPVVAAGIALWLAALAWEVARPDLVRIFRGSDQTYWRVAAGVKEAGVRPGDTVAFIGRPFDAYWARLAGVRITAEIPADGATEFLKRGPVDRERIMKIFRKAGVEAVISDILPASTRLAGWKRIQGTGYFIRKF